MPMKAKVLSSSIHPDLAGLETMKLPLLGSKMWKLEEWASEQALCVSPCRLKSFHGVLQRENCLTDMTMLT